MGEISLKQSESLSSDDDLDDSFPSSFSFTIGTDFLVGETLSSSASSWKFDKESPEAELTGSEPLQ